MVANAALRRGSLQMSVDRIDDHGAPDVYDAGWRRARNERQCCACHETIRRGDRYAYNKTLFEGSWSAWCWCARCKTMIDHLDVRLADPDEECDPHLDCGHTYEERFDEPPPPEIARLAFLTPDEAQEMAR